MKLNMKCRKRFWRKFSFLKQNILQHCSAANIDMACDTLNAHKQLFSTSKSIESESYLNPCKTTWECRYFFNALAMHSESKDFARASAAVFIAFLLHLNARFSEVIYKRFVYNVEQILSLFMHFYPFLVRTDMKRK